MSSTALKTIYLKEYTPPPFVIDRVKLHFELGEEQTVVTTAMTMRRDMNMANIQPWRGLTYYIKFSTTTAMKEEIYKHNIKT